MGSPVLTHTRQNTAIAKAASHIRLRNAIRVCMPFLLPASQHSEQHVDCNQQRTFDPQHPIANNHATTTSLSANQIQLHATGIPSPHTPINGVSYADPRRPPTLRTELQTAEAERDALQALFQLGSPHTSQMNGFRQQSSQTSSSQASPLRNDFAGPMSTPRRVTFARSESDSSAQMSTNSDGTDVPRGGEQAMQTA